MSDQPIDDLMGNPVTQIEVDSEENDVEFEIVDARPEEDQVDPRVGPEPDYAEFDSEIEGVDKDIEGAGRTSTKNSVSSVQPLEFSAVIV